MDVFVYGTLTDPKLAGAVLDEFVDRGPAELVGLHRVLGEYPTLAPGGSVTGRVLVTEDVVTLDRYEGVDRGLYIRMSVSVVDQAGVGRTDDTVETYVGDPDRLDAPVEWPGDGPFRDRVHSYFDENEIGIRVQQG